MREIIKYSLVVSLLFLSCKQKDGQENVNAEEATPATEQTNSQNRSTIDNNEESSIDFWAMGNEPFWNMEITSEKIVVYTMEDTLIAPPVKSQVRQETQVRTYMIQTEGLYMGITVEPGPCSDTMSDNLYPYAVTVQYKAKRGEPRTILMGCGAYRLEEGLEGDWTLNTLGGREMESSDFGKGLPTIAFDDKSQSFSGSTGCNRMNGTLDYSPNIFSLKKIMTTKAFCSQGQENENAFLKGLDTVTGYELKGDILIFLSGEGEVMTFKR